MNEDMLRQLELVAVRLTTLQIDFAFVGGAVVGLLITDPSTAPPRPTNDVDVIVGSCSRIEHAGLEARLRQQGFRHDTTAGAPICRWLLDDVLVDIMPVDSRVFGWHSCWFSEALNDARLVEITAGRQIPIVTAPFLLAMKLDAFDQRGDNDYYGSHDLEDIVTLTDGRPELVGEVATAPLPMRKFIATELSRLLSDNLFIDAVRAHLPMDQVSQRRHSFLLERFHQIIHSGQGDS